MEYFPLGDLSEFISAGEIQEEDAKQIATDLLIALEIIHTEGFTHRDLKPQVGIPFTTNLQTSGRHHSDG